MTQSCAEDRIIRLLWEILPTESSPDEMKIAVDAGSTLDLDSLQVIEFVSVLETEFRIEVTDDDLLHQLDWLSSVQSIAAFVSQRVGS